MKKNLIALLLLVLVLPVMAQVQNTNPPPSGIGGLESTVLNYFTAFDTNMPTFQNTRFDLWTGASSLQGGAHPLLNDLGGSFDLWHPGTLTNSPVKTALSLEVNTRNEGVLGSLVSVQGGIGFSAIIWDTKATLYLDGGSYLDPLESGEKWSDRLFGEVGVRVKKGIGAHFYMGVGLAAQFGPAQQSSPAGKLTKASQVLSAFAGTTF